jgi:hypothetical protein
MKEITAYECEHCGKYLKTKKSIKAHEPICFNNPQSRSCITCNNFSTYWVEDGEMEIRECSQSQIIQHKLKTNCAYYSESKES